jgi:hypothetical protein
LIGGTLVRFHQLEHVTPSIFARLTCGSFGELLRAMSPPSCASGCCAVDHAPGI